MAEAVVNFAIETLGFLLNHEIKLLGSAKQEVKIMQGELESIRAFLKVAAARAAAEGGENNEDVLTWVTQVSEEAYRIEDVIHGFSFTVARLPNGGGLMGVLHKITRFVKKLKLWCEIGNEIQDIKLSLDYIIGRADKYKFSSTDHRSSSRNRNIVVVQRGDILLETNRFGC